MTHNTTKIKHFSLTSSLRMVPQKLYVLSYKHTIYNLMCKIYTDSYFRVQRHFSLITPIVFMQNALSLCSKDIGARKVYRHRKYISSEFLIRVCWWITTLTSPNINLNNVPTHRGWIEQWFGSRLVGSGLTGRSWAKSWNAVKGALLTPSCQLSFGL